MSILRRSLSVGLLACALVACSSDGEKPAQKDAGSDEATNEEDAGDDMEPEPEADAGMTPTAPVPLTVWVDDLVDNHTSDESEPDTVDDKVIRDDTDETSFDKYLP